MTESIQSGAPSPCRPLPCYVLLAILTAYVLVVAAVSSDGEALLAFKVGLDDPTGILNSWNGADPYPCLWYGVTCNEDLKVQRLLLQGTQLSGSISPVLRNLTELRTLVLSRNNFSGPLPTELGLIGRVSGTLLWLIYWFIDLFIIGFHMLDLIRGWLRVRKDLCRELVEAQC